MPSLTIEKLCVEYRVERPSGPVYVPALRDVSLRLGEGETLGVLGETGSGKSTVALSIMGLLPDTAKRSGHVQFGDTELSALPERKLRKIRGSGIGMIFQDAATALNPVRTIGAQIVDVVRRHHPGLSRQAAKQRAVQAVESVGVPARRLGAYPHELSGGMRQRALIAAVMAAEPSFIVADEPTSDLDKLTERQIIALIKRLQAESGVGLVVISHDLAVVSALCNYVAVMFHGEIVEYGPCDVVFADPQNEYTAGLIRVSRRERDGNGRLATIRTPAEVTSSPAQ
jgi:ABC-type dipeptide/oligopeptide/nickel transport system ATPase component